MTVVPEPVQLIPVHTIPKEFGAVQITAGNMEELCRLMSAGDIYTVGTSFAVAYYDGAPVSLDIGFNGRTITLEVGEWLLISMNHQLIRVTDEDFRKKYVVEVVDPVV